MKRILLDPKNAIVKQYTKLLELDNVSLHFDDSALNAIVDKAITLKLGARGLRSIIERIMTDAMFDLAAVGNELKITTEYVEKKCEDII